MRQLLIALAVLTFACGDEPPAPTPTPSPTPWPTPSPTPNPGVGYDCSRPPTFTGLVKSKTPAKGKYIVRLKSDLSASSVQAASQKLSAKFRAKDVRSLRRGFAGVLDVSAAQELAADPSVQAVFEETVHKALELPGLDRVDQRDLPLDGQYNPGAFGSGVHVAIIDTGVTEHPDFAGRLAPDCFTAHTFGGCSDQHSHGTHVAGTVGGERFGVAKGVTLYAVRVLDRFGSGTTSQVIQGVEWVAARKRANPSQSWVANLSLGGSADAPLDQAVCDAIADGVAHAIAAGNDGTDARNSSPARVVQAMTIGAINPRNDSAPSWTNYGPLIDWFAPGVDIESARPDGGSATFSGTSMATPHSAGAAALYLQRHPGAPPQQVHDGLVLAATLNKLSGIKNSPNRLLYVKE